MKKAFVSRLSAALITVTLGMGTGKLACTAATTWLAGCVPGGEMPNALSWAGLRLAN